MSDPVLGGLLPLKMASATVAFDQFGEQWTLAEPDAETEDGHRSCTAHVAFEYPFDSIPVVHTGITGFDIDNNDTARLSVRVETIYTTGFDLVLETGRSTRVYGVQVGWLALGN